jgi:hypothetical protein
MPPRLRAGLAVVGSSTAAIGVILSAGKPERLACSRINSALVAW